MRVSWRTFIQGFYSYNVTLQYAGLEPSQTYTLQIVYFSDGQSGDSSIPYRLTANGVYVLHDYMPAPYPMQKLSFALSAALTASGELTIQCNQLPGESGSGRSCQISEVWLLPSSVPMEIQRLP